MRIGAHVSVSRSLAAAAEKAHEIGANTLQIFTQSPRMWRAVDLDPADVKRFRAARDRLGLSPLAIHGNYLINLASADQRVRRNSIASYRGEL